MSRGNYTVSKEKDIMRIWQLTAMAIVALLGLAACESGMYVYMTCVDQVTPEIPGLVVEGGVPYREGTIDIF